MTDLKPCPRPRCEAKVDHFHHRPTGVVLPCDHNDSAACRETLNYYTECYTPRTPESKPLPDIKDVKPGDWVELSSGDAKISGTAWALGGESLGVGDRVMAMIRLSSGAIRPGWTLTDYRAAEPLIPDWPIGCLVEVVKPVYGYAVGDRLRLIPAQGYECLPNSAEDVDGDVWAASEGDTGDWCWPADCLRLVPEPDRPDWWQTRGAVAEDEDCWLWTCHGSTWRHGAEAMSYDTLAAEHDVRLVSLPVGGAK